MNYTRIFATEDGESRMETIEVRFGPVDLIPGQPSLDLSPPLDAQSATFLRTPTGWAGGWHPTPRRQLAIALSGELEMQATDGQTRRIRVGDLVLLDDTTGKGHHTRVVGGASFSCVLVALS